MPRYFLRSCVILYIVFSFGYVILEMFALLLGLVGTLYERGERMNQMDGFICNILLINLIKAWRNEISWCYL